MADLRKRSGPGALAAVLVAVSLAVPARAEDTATGGVSPCVTRYHAALGRIAEGEFQAVTSATRSTNAGDDRLPGLLMFPPPAAANRTKAETAALRIAAALARSKGRSTGPADADAEWMADRLRLGLSDYLRQAPSPYLCGGVAEYMDALGGFAARLGVSPGDLDAASAAGRTVAARAIDEALAALKPAPAPRPAPDDRPSGALVDGLRPAAGLDRTPTGSLAAAPAVPQPDPDLPPLAAPAEPALRGAADLAAAVDRLTTAAAVGGWTTATVLPASAGLSIAPDAFPALARLAAARPLVSGARPLIADRIARGRAAAALSALETLDYLARAAAAPADPRAAAVERTFEAILKAQAAECTCGE